MNQSLSLQDRINARKTELFRQGLAERIHRHGEKIEAGQHVLYFDGFGAVSRKVLAKDLKAVVKPCQEAK